MPQTDASAVALARDGDSDAFRALVDRHSRAVYRLAHRMTGNPQDAEDVVQETFLKLFRHLDSGGDTRNIRGWLFTVAAHAARDRQRARRRWIPWLPAHEPHVQPASMRDEDGRLKQARAALGRLPERDRRLLLLRAQGLSYREIADAAGIRPGSVGRLLARAVDRWAATRKDGNEYGLLEERSHPGTR